jgi:hypothetical protein
MTVDFAECPYAVAEERSMPPPCPDHFLESHSAMMSLKLPGI